MTKLEELHKLKDQATRALEKRNFERAATLYLEIADRDPEPDWRQRAGDAFRRAGETKRAIAVLTAAAEQYAQGGFLLKAIAVSKTLLQLDPTNGATQASLAALYARRETTAPRAASLPHASRPTPAPLRPPGVLNSPPTSASSDSIVPPPEFALPLLVDESVTTPIELIEDPSDPGAPMEILPLRRVLGGVRSDPFARTDDAAPIVHEHEPATYEITLDEADLVEEVAAAPVEEDDWSGVMNDGAVAAISVSAPLTPPPPLPPSALPKIPLFSSLPSADLLHVIQRMKLHELEDGQVVVKEGERGGSLYVVVDGEVGVTVGAGVHRRDLARLRTGAFFGELGLLTDDPRSATVTAIEPTRLLEISRELAWEVINRAPEVLRTLLRFFRDRMLDRMIDVSPLFAGLPREEAGKLASQFVFLELEPGVLPIRAGTRSPGLYFLMCGEAEAVRDGQRLGLLGPGDVFGEMSMLLRTPAVADVRVLRKTWVMQLPQSRFQEVVLAYVSELGDQRTHLGPPPDADPAFVPRFASPDIQDSRRIEIA